MNTIDESNINKIYLMIGFNCNFHCRYCHQVPIKKENLSSKFIPQKIYNYIDKLIEIKKDKKLTILFWGGEPLLYWNIIQKLVIHYNDKLRYTIISNGSLLDQEKVDFLNKYSIHIVISHDGPNTVKTRKIDILQIPIIIYYLNQINNKSFDAVLSGYNYDFNKLYDYWEQLFPYIYGNIEMLRISWDMPEDLIDIDLNEYRNGLKTFFQNSIDKVKKEIFSIKTLAAIKYIKRIKKSIEKQKYHFPLCGQVQYNMNIDLDGNIYACHNCSIKVGDISEDREIYLQRYYNWLETKKKSECETCDAKYFCQGGCPLDINNSACILQKILYEGAKISYENNKEIWDDVNINIV